MDCETFATMEELLLALMRVAAYGTVYFNSVNVAVDAGTSTSYISCDNNHLSLAEALPAALTTDADGNLAINIGKIT